MNSSIPIVDKERFQRIINKALNEDRKISLEGLSLDDWLTLRTMIGIGASEVAAVLGMNQ